MERGVERSRRRVNETVRFEHGFEGRNGAGNGDIVVVVVSGSGPGSGVVMVAVEPKDSGGFGKHLGGESCREREREKEGGSYREGKRGMGFGEKKMNRNIFPSLNVTYQRKGEDRQCVVSLPRRFLVCSVLRLYLFILFF